MAGLNTNTNEEETLFRGLNEISGYLINQMVLFQVADLIFGYLVGVVVSSISKLTMLG